MAARRARMAVLSSFGPRRPDLGCEQQARYRGGILQRQPRHLGRVQDARFEHVAELAVAAL